MRHYLGILIAIFLLGIPWFALTYPAQTRNILSTVTDVSDQLAAVILSHKPKTIAEIQSKYTASSNGNLDKKVRVLIVPGHEPNYGGAEYGSVKERELAVELANDLSQFIESNSHYQVFVTRDNNQWNPIFSTYFQNEWDDIIAWDKASHQEMSHLISVGSMKQTTPTVIHNNAPTDVALRLYGITKWANENDIDIVIHIHFNDYSGRQYKTPGEYSGFAIYVPEKQYSNSPSTKAIADAVFDRLKKYNPVSDFPGESTGIIEEPDLIAVGANNTSDAASMLIEYGYLYEPQFVNPELRGSALKNLAFQTYLGLQDFFDPNNAVNKHSE